MSKKQRLYIDMDGVIVDFASALRKVDKATLEQYRGVEDEIPGLFDLMEPMPGAIEAVTNLAKHYDTYILSTAPWLNPWSWTSKINWIHRHFGSDKDSPLYKRVIISHNKHLCKGDYLIDDRLKHGVEFFEGEHIHFGTEKFADWNKVLEYLIASEDSYFEKAQKELLTVLEANKIPIEDIHLKCGSVVSQFIVTLKDPTKLKRVKRLDVDIMLSLCSYRAQVIVNEKQSDRFIVEIVNQEPQSILLVPALEELQLHSQTKALPLFLGETVGRNYFADLARMPHLLIGGKAETGKTALIQNMIRLLKATKTSEELIFIVIASQEKDAESYRALIEWYSMEEIDIISSVEYAVAALNGLAEEMNERYEKLRNAEVRNIAQYNATVEPMPYIVVVVDEFGDWMHTAGRELESPLALLAQLARAIGIHIIAATNHCSANVITALLKTNFPARIAFRTENLLESRLIIDTPGAQFLLPYNDFYLSDGEKLTRIQTP